MSIITARSTFTPAGDVRRLVDLFVMVKVFAGVKRVQAIVVEDAQAHAPTLTGELASSIHALEPVDDGKQITGGVVAEADHAGFVEFGTGLAGAGTYPYPLPTEGVPITGSWIYDYKNQNWPGMVARPYLRPALDTARSRALQEFVEA